MPPDLDVDEDFVSTSNEITPTEQSDTEAFHTVFEPDSPNRSTVPVVDFSASPDELSIEPVLAACTPPPTADPAHGSALREVPEEDESDDGHSTSAEDPEVHGLRIVMSPSFSGSPESEVSSYSLSTPMHERRATLDEADIPYDAMRERGPGHPLFPSSFAHLTLAPTLRANRSQSVFYPPQSAYLATHRTGTDGVMDRTGRPEWAQNWDASRHEFAVASSAGSASGRE